MTSVPSGLIAGTFPGTILIYGSRTPTNILESLLMNLNWLEVSITLVASKVSLVQWRPVHSWA